MRFNSFIVLLLSGLIFHSFSLSGIAVSDFSCSDKDLFWIDAHFFENDEWQDSVILVTSPNKLSVRDPAINTHGTHCAFIMRENNTWKICVTRIKGKNRLIKEITTVNYGGDDNTKGEIYSMLIEWPRGDWIWFSDRCWADGLSRVNVHTGQVQDVVTFNETKIWSISGDTRWLVSEHCRIGMHRMPDADSLLALNAGPVRLNYSCTYWNDGGNRIYNDGCGQSVSITGEYIYYNSYNTHEDLHFVHRDPGTNQTEVIERINKWAWNEMAVDTTSAALHCCDQDNTGDCVGHQPVEFLGRQTHTLAEWAVNSEKWNCVTFGWGGMGRYMEGGGNVGTINWDTKKSINLTQHPCDKDSVRNPEGLIYQIWHSDLWISGPEEDIAEGYMEDILNRDSYHIEGTDSLTDPIPIAIPVRNNSYKKTIRIAKESIGDRIISLPFASQYKVKLYNALGVLISQSKGFGKDIIIGEKFISGLHFAIVTHNGFDQIYTFANLK